MYKTKFIFQLKTFQSTRDLKIKWRGNQEKKKRNEINTFYCQKWYGMRFHSEVTVVNILNMTPRSLLRTNFVQ